MCYALLLLCWMASGARAGEREIEEREDRYLYEDTRRLVRRVEEAAEQLEQKGEVFFNELGKPGTCWLNKNTYFFAYDLNGVCVFHPIARNLIGKNLLDLKDFHGKPVIRNIVAIAARPEPAACGWVFYLWEEGIQLTPSWKSSYIRKVVLPDGRIYAVGAGLYNIKMEETFIKERVNLAVEDIRTQGSRAAFADFRSTAFPYIFLDTCIFVLDGDGQTLVDPSYPNQAGRSLYDFQDTNGRYTIRELINKLNAADEAWVQYLWPKPGELLPSRKLVYARKVAESNRVLIVGCDYFVPTPIWMK